MEVDYHSILVSYDVTSLFTTVPVDETIQILAEKEIKRTSSGCDQIFILLQSVKTFSPALLTIKLLLVSIKVIKHGACRT